MLGETHLVFRVVGRVVGDWRNFLEQLSKAVTKQPFERIFLDLNEVRHVRRHLGVAKGAIRATSAASGQCR